MTGLVARGIGSIRAGTHHHRAHRPRIGWVLGGVVGVGTVVYALAIGPLLHVLLPRLQVRSLACLLRSRWSRGAGVREETH